MKKLFALLVMFGTMLCMSAGFEMPQLSEKEMEELANYEQQIMGEIEQYVNSLSPQEQEEFARAVEEEARKLEQMSPDELNRYIEDTFNEAGVSAPVQPAAAPKPDTTETQKQEETTAPEPTVAQPLEKQDAALKVVNDLIAALEQFMRKVRTITELPGKFERWGNKGFITGWQEDLTWNDVKEKLEVFNQKLYKLKEKDTKTEKYIYLNDLIEDDAAYANLTKIGNEISKWEPKFEGKAFDFEPMSTTSKEAARKTLSSFLEGVYILDIPIEIDRVIAKYDPVAKKLLEQEEAARKKALEEGKQPKYITPARISSPSTGRDFGYGNYGGYDPYDDYNYGDYSPSYSSYSPGSSYAPNRSDRQAHQRRQPNRASRGLSPASTGKEEAGPQEGAPAPTGEVPGTRRRMDDIAQIIEHAAESVGQINSAEITKAGPADANSTQQIYSAYRNLKKGIDKVRAHYDHLRRIKATNAQLESAKNELNSLIDEHKPTFDDFIQATNRIKGQEAKVPAEKKQAYITGPQSIYDVKTAIDELRNSINSLGAGKTLAEPTAPVAPSTEQAAPQQSNATPTEDPAEQRRKKRIEEIVADTKNLLTEINSLVEGNPHLKGLANYRGTVSNQTEIEAAQIILPQIRDNLVQVDKNLTDLARVMRPLTNEEKAQVKQQLSSHNMAAFSNLLQVVNQLKTARDTSDPNAQRVYTSLPAQLRWAFFGGPISDISTQAEQQRLQNLNFTPVSLFDIANQLNTIATNINNLSN